MKSKRNIRGELAVNAIIASIIVLATLVLLTGLFAKQLPPFAEKLYCKTLNYVVKKNYCKEENIASVKVSLSKKIISTFPNKKDTVIIGKGGNITVTLPKSRILNASFYVRGRKKNYAIIQHLFDFSKSKIYLTNITVPKESTIESARTIIVNKSKVYEINNFTDGKTIEINFSVSKEKDVFIKLPKENFIKAKFEIKGYARNLTVDIGNDGKIDLNVTHLRYKNLDFTNELNRIIKNCNSNECIVPVKIKEDNGLIQLYKLKIEYEKYLKDFYFDIGDDGKEDCTSQWAEGDYLFKECDFTELLKEKISECKEDLCVVPVKIKSSDGILELKDFKVSYLLPVDAKIKVNNKEFALKLNKTPAKIEFLDILEKKCDNCKININISANGTITLSNLRIEIESCFLEEDFVSNIISCWKMAKSGKLNKDIICSELAVPDECEGTFINERNISNFLKKNNLCDIIGTKYCGEEDNLEIKTNIIKSMHNFLFEYDSKNKVVVVS